MLWHKNIGAGGTGGGSVEITYVGSVTKQCQAKTNWDSSAEAPDVVGTGSVGDLVYVEVATDLRTFDTSTVFSGMSFTQLDRKDGSNPDVYTGYGFITPSSVNPYLSSSVNSGIGGISAVFSIFSFTGDVDLIAKAADYTQSEGDATNAGAVPSADPSGSTWYLAICSTSVDNTVSNANDVIQSAPSGYTLAAQINSALSGSSDAATAVAYKIVAGGDSTTESGGNFEYDGYDPDAGKSGTPSTETGNTTTYRALFG